MTCAWGSAHAHVSGISLTFIFTSLTHGNERQPHVNSAIPAFLVGS